MLSHRSRILAATAAVALFAGVHSATAADFPGSVQGVVKSASGEALSGAYVKLFNAERRLTFMVISQAEGHYSLNNLPPGEYTVQGIGNGFQSKPAPVTLVADKPATADVSLTDQQGPVVPNGWIRSPGRVAGNELDAELPPPVLPDGPGKAIVEAKCNQCHFLRRLTQMRWTKDNWEKKITWMRERIHERGVVDLTDEEQKIVVDYLAANFNNTVPKADPNGRLSRTLLKGAAAKYIAVDFAVPNSDSALHDITVDPRGVAWVNELNQYKLGRFDPKTYEFTEIDPPPGPRKVGTLNHMGPPVRGAGDMIWMQEVGTNRRWLEFNTKTQEFSVFPASPDFKGQMNGNSMRVDPNGKMVWSTAGYRVVGLNLETKEFTAYEIPYYTETKRDPGAYGIDVAGDGKVWFAEREANRIGRLDPATGKIEEFKTPGVDVPRRMGSDWNGNIWVGYHETSKLVKYDEKTGQATPYDPPTPNNGAYIPVADPVHQVIWLTEQTADKIARFDPKNGTWTEFSLPIIESDARRIEIDPTNPNRIWWSGDTSSHLGYIEVLDQ
ncbi:MAG TPA: carboxypeptidase regulatory-like domain-containing protein [Xanthobacteraceae bacterium]|nr:carboxypeptidase regulatory-like domain-containing protein [Xanthobacteraceae bacterium]